MLLEDYKGVDKGSDFSRAEPGCRAAERIFGVGIECAYAALRSASVSRSHGGSVQDSRWGEQGGQAILSASALIAAAESLRASLDPAYLQGGGYDSRQCRRHTDSKVGNDRAPSPYTHCISTMLPGTSTQPSRLPMATPIRSAVPSSSNSDTCLKTLDPFSRAPPRRIRARTEDFRGARNRHRMRYAALKEQGLPIGSGVTEAACDSKQRNA